SSSDGRATVLASANGTPLWGRTDLVAQEQELAAWGRPAPIRNLHKVLEVVHLFSVGCAGHDPLQFLQQKGHLCGLELGITVPVDLAEQLKTRVVVVGQGSIEDTLWVEEHFSYGSFRTEELNLDRHRPRLLHTPRYRASTSRCAASSAGVPAKTIVPLFMTRTRCPTLVARPRFCSTRRRASPVARSPSRISPTCSTSFGASPSEGSSRSRT